MMEEQHMKLFDDAKDVTDAKDDLPVADELDGSTDKLITKHESSSLSPKTMLQTVDQIDHPSGRGFIKSSVLTRLEEVPSPMQALMDFYAC
uniref:Uncharacterized protein n=1 Tax=Tanacetum cinerariifolium TaxID=118510 RepID=A0A699GYX9_TANCI|nr:hypothetical protein [Tanacetum cinerariifolium]